MKRIILTDTLLEKILLFLIEDETGGFIIDVMMQSSSKLNKRLLNKFFYPMVKRAPRMFGNIDNPHLCVAWSPSQRIVSGSCDGMIRIWDTITGKQIGEPLKDKNRANEIEFTNDIVPTKELMPEAGTRGMRKSSGYVWCVAWSPDGRRIASGNGDGTVNIWHIDSRKLLMTLMQTFPHPNWKGLSDCTHGVLSVAWSPDGQRIVTGSEDYYVRIWDTNNGTLSMIEPHSDKVNSVAWSPNGKRIASGCHDGNVQIWDAQTGKSIAISTRPKSPNHDPLEDYGYYVISVAWSPDSKKIVSGGDKINIWDGYTGNLIKTLGSHGNMQSVASVAWSPDGRKIVSGGDDWNVRIWDAQSGKPIEDPSRLITPVDWTYIFKTKSVNVHTGEVYSVAWSSDSQRVVSGSNDQTLRIWMI